MSAVQNTHGAGTDRAPAMSERPQGPGRRRRRWGLVLPASAAAALACADAPCAAEVGAARPNSWGYAFPAQYDAEVAAPEAHRIRYQDDHIRFMEVSNPPGYRMRMHGHPYPSVFARDSGGVTPTGLAPKETFLDPDSKQNGQNWRHAPPPTGEGYPTCTSADPQAPHRPVNDGDTPLHFYRIEFKRTDQGSGLETEAPYRWLPMEIVRYETPSVRLVETTLRPRERLAGHRGQRPSVLAFDSVATFNALDAVAPPQSGRSGPPQGMSAPRCMTLPRGGLPSLANSTSRTLHFYRIEFKRVDGEQLRQHWRDWYPFMRTMR